MRTTFSHLSSYYVQKEIVNLIIISIFNLIHLSLSLSLSLHLSLSVYLSADYPISRRICKEKFSSLSLSLSLLINFRKSIDILQVTTDYQCMKDLCVVYLTQKKHFHFYVIINVYGWEVKVNQKLRPIGITIRIIFMHFTLILCLKRVFLLHIIYYF